MSNQVYSDTKHKYFAQPGVSVFWLPTNTAITTTGVEATITWESGIQTPETAVDNWYIESGSNMFIANKEGLYSVQMMFVTQWTGNPSTPTVDFEALAEIWKIDDGGATNGLVLAAHHIRDVAKGSDPGSNDRVYTLSFVSYFTRDQGFQFRYINYDTANVMTIVRGSDAVRGTRMVVTKLL